jgi:hypothetical protein
MALKPLNSVGGFSVGEIPANVILANADIISNNLTVQKVANLGPVGNVIITGGSANQYLQTDGAGNLTWTTADTSRILNGTSNVSIPVANGNVNTSVGGTANVFVVTSTGANVTGTFESSGNLTALNANLGNLVTANFANFANDVVVQGNIANANNISVTNNVNAVVGNFSGNINSLNANLGNLATANFVNVSSNLNVTNTANVGNLRTDNLLHANGTPWDFQQPAGANTELQYNDGAGGFGASSALTFDYAGNVLTVAGNANLTAVNTSNVNSANSLYLTANGFTLSLYANGLAEFEDGILTTGNLTVGNANLGNLATANFVNVSSNLNVTDTANVGNLRTDNLLYANGQPWDLQEAAGANTEIQYNMGNNFAASANFTYNDTTQVLKVTGNANITNTLLTPNVNSGTGNLTLTANGFNTVYDSNGNVTFPGNVTAHTFYGNVNANITVTAANTSVLYSDNGLISGASGFTFDKSSNLFSTPGNLDVADALNVTNPSYIDTVYIENSNISGGANALQIYSTNSASLNFNNASYVIANTNGVYQTANGFTANLDNSGNVSLPNNLSVVGNIANANNISITNDLTSNNANITANLTSGNANLGNLAQANFVNVASNVTTSNLTVNLELAGNTANFSGNVVLPNLTVNLELAGNTANFTGNVQTHNLGVNLELSGNTANFTGNIAAANANLGNLVLANFVNVASNLHTVNANVTGTLEVANANIASNLTVNNLTVNLELAGNTANFTGNVTLSGPNVTVNNYLSGNIANFSGNITSLNANLGNIADANYVRTQQLYNGSANIDIINNGNIAFSPNLANVMVLSNVGANVTGYVTANGNGTFGAVYSNTVTAQGGNLELRSFQSGDTYIELRPHGNGTVDVGNVRITSLATPTAQSDAATKQYVDDVAQGLNVHDSALAATANTLAILTGGTITYNNGTGGVGANLVLSGSPTANYLSANAFDGNVTAVVGSRILVKSEANAAHNGVYVVDSSTVLTRATDYNSVPEVEAGDFIFVQDGDTYNDSGWVQTSVVTTIGTDPIVFTQFSGAGTYQAGAGLTLTGTVFSVNVDNITTEINGGNVIVKANAQFTTPNIGAATGTSVDLTGNVLAGNVNSNAKVTAVDFEASGNVLANFISANANLLVNNATINVELSGNTANFSGNVIVPNLQVNTTLSGNVANFSGNLTSQNANLGNLATANYINVANTLTTLDANVTGTLTVANANISSNLTVNNLTVNNELSGNTANFSGNVVLPNLTVNLSLVGNTANFSGNVVVPNLTVNLELAGNTANFSGNIVAGNISTSGSGGNITGANVVSANTFVGNLDATSADISANLVTSNATVNLELAGNTANFSGNVTLNNLLANGVANVGNLYVQANVTSSLNPNANLTIDLGTASQRWGNVYAGNIDASGNLTLAGNISANNFSANTLSANTSVDIGTSQIVYGNVTTTATTANQTIASATISGVTGIEWIVKGYDSSGSKYSMAIVTAVTDGTSADYSTFGTVNLGSTTGSLAVNVVGSNIELQVTPSSSNSTVWVTQYRTI